MKRTPRHIIKMMVALVKPSPEDIIIDLAMGSAGFLIEAQSYLRDNLSETRDSRKAHFTRGTEVVECCQMCWISNGMQHICNKYATRISMICIGHFQRNLGMSFLNLNLINCIYKLLYIKVGIYFFGQSHSTGVSHNLLDNCLIDTGFC